MSGDPSPLQDEARFEALLALRPELAALSEAEREALTAAIDEGVSAWSLGEDVSVGALLEGLARRTTEEGAPLLTPHWLKSAPHLTDLLLAVACELGSPSAIAAFRSRYAPELHGVTQRFLDDGSRREDLLQSLEEVLFVAPAKIARYGASGPLYAWLRVTASRHFIDLKRSRAQARHDTPLAQELLTSLVDTSEDVELRFFKDHYRAQFKQALEEAVATLTAEQRVLLRQSFIERLSIDALSAVHGVHRATVARHITQAKEALFAATKQLLMQRLQIDADEFDSIFDLIKSRLDVSFNRLLVSHTSPPSSR